jgi:hypothetical protein
VLCPALWYGFRVEDDWGENREDEAERGFQSRLFSEDGSPADSDEESGRVEKFRVFLKRLFAGVVDVRLYPPAAELGLPALAGLGFLLKFLLSLFTVFTYWRRDFIRGELIKKSEYLLKAPRVT